jgi:hypothetical protein
MIIVWGSGLYGKCDEIPGGLFHVATKFGHIYYLPLVPTASHIILSKDGDGFRGVDIGLSGKSILLAWLRAGLIVGGICMTIAGIVMMNDKPSSGSGGMGTMISGIVCLAALIATYFLKPFRYASYKRAHFLADKMGMNERGKILLDLAYGVVTEQEAEAALRGYDAAAAEREADEQRIASTAAARLAASQRETAPLSELAAAGIRAEPRK